jgi:hypothetical protein
MTEDDGENDGSFFVPPDLKPAFGCFEDASFLEEEIPWKPGITPEQEVPQSIDHHAQHLIEFFF